MKKIVFSVPLSLAIVFSPYSFASLTTDASSRGVDQSVQQFSANQEVAEVLFVDQNGSACRLSKDNGAAKSSLPSELYSLSNEVSELSSVQECDNSTTQTALVIAGDAYHPQTAALPVVPIAFAASCAVGAASVALVSPSDKLLGNAAAAALGAGTGTVSLTLVGFSLVGEFMTIAGANQHRVRILRNTGIFGAIASTALLCRGATGAFVYFFKNK